MRVLFLFTCLFFYAGISGYSQPCSTLGQTPSTAFPVCGTTVFQQTSVPLCRPGDLFVPGCPKADGYGDRNPFYYRFTCYVSGTLGFVITPNAPNDDYDWQLYDITGRNPNDVYLDNNGYMIVSGNWSGTYGPTGASASGISGIQCASDPAANLPTFAIMPNLVQGHEYLLMVSHFLDTQNGYALSFGGGTAVITDPLAPHLLKATPDCNGKVLTVKMNKRMRCSTLTASGTEFSISPAAATVISAVAPECANGFDFDSLIVTLSNPVPAGNYQFIIKNGSDGNTVSDICGQFIPQNEQVAFAYVVPQPISIDSIGRAGCAPDSLRVYFPKNILCNTIKADGSDFVVTGPTPVTVTGASGNCINGGTDYITVKLSSPIYTKGTYTLSIQPGFGGGPLVDVCGLPVPPQSKNFITADTVSARFSYITAFDCLSNTLTFSHDGAHDVNQWNWLFNNSIAATTQSYTIKFPSKSTNTIHLSVSNGVCTDSSSQTITFNNEVKAAFTMPDVICPEDPLFPKDTSSGQIDAWLWKYDVLGTSNLQTPPPFYFPNDNIERYYTIKLIVTNNTLNCSDSTRKIIRVLNNCVIAVPNAFTPNNDGLNDFFWPHNALKADNLEFKVYNRWGQLMFSSRNWMDKWNGKFNGVDQPAGVYVWFLRYTHRDTGQKVFQKGTVMLIR
jgi:gliding motility-associated-like protein